MSTIDPKTPRPFLYSVPDQAEPLPEPERFPVGALATAEALDLVKRTLLARMTEHKRAAIARDQATNAKLDRVLEAVGRLEARPDHSLAIGHIRELVGQPPGAIDPRSSHVGRWTPDELADIERNGTGLFRLIGQLASQDRSILASIADKAGSAAGTRSAAITSVAATAPTWAPIVWDVASSSPQGAAAVVGVALGGAVIAITRFIRTRKNLK